MKRLACCRGPSSLILGFALALLSAHEARAQSVTPIPSTLRIPLGRPGPATISLVWRAVGGPAASSSAGNVVLDDPSQTVLQTLPPFPAQVGTLVDFPETISLSTRDLELAALRGVRVIKVVRKFNVGGNIVAAAIIQLSSPLGSDFVVTRIQLRLGEGSPLRLIARGAKVSAWADVSYAGTGELEALWELSEPASSAGAPVYRPLRRVRRPLGGGGRLSLPAPELPSDRTGLYLVRLQVLEPAPDFEAPVLRYYVAPEDGIPSEPVAIVLGEPAQLAELRPDTVFTWRPVAGAKAYRLEFRPGDRATRDHHIHFDPENPSYADAGPASRVARAYESGDVTPPPVPDVVTELLEEAPQAGLLVRGEERSARLGAVTRSRLAPGSTYVWLVRALGERGVAIGVSPARLIRIPE